MVGRKAKGDMEGRRKGMLKEGVMGCGQGIGMRYFIIFRDMLDR